MKSWLYTLSLVVLSLAVHGQQSLLVQDFEGAVGQRPPAGWSIELINGQASLDSFGFEDSLYFLAPPIQGQYALFDSYKGGQLIGTNANGTGEEVALRSPWIHGIPSNGIFLGFAYHFVRYSKASFHVDVQSDSTAWTTVWSTSSSTVYSTDQELDLQAFAGQDSIRIRFRWKNTESLPNQGLVAIDQIHLYHKLALDVAVLALEVLDTNLMPGLDFRPVLQIENRGRDTAFAIPLELSYSGLLSLTQRDTLGSLVPGALVVVPFPPITTDSAGALHLDFRSLLADSLAWNNSVSLHYAVLPRPSEPILAADTLCGPGSTELHAAAAIGQEVLWYDDSGFLGAGNSVQSPWITQSQYFQAEQRRVRARFVSTFQGAMRRNGNPTGGSYFSIFAKHALRIDSVLQHCAYQASNTRIKLYYRTGNYKGYERQPAAWQLILSDTQNAQGWGHYLSLGDPGILLDSGAWHSFYLTVEGGASPTFHADSFRYENRDLILRADAMNPFAFGGILTPYAWNGRLYYKRLSPGYGDSVEAVVLPLPSGSIWVEGKGNEGRFRSGRANDPDIIAVDRNMAYEITAPSGYSWGNHGVDWELYSIDLSANQGHLVADTDTQMVWGDSTFNTELTFSPDAGWEGHTLHMRLRIRFTEGHCDTLLERWVFVAPTPEISVETSEVCDGDTALFISNSSIVSGTLKHWWYFGPNDSIEATAAAYRFPSAGLFPVRLRLISNLGVEADTIIHYRVHARPRAAFEAVNACLGRPVQLNNTSTPDTVALTSYWDFGDGDTAMSTHAQHAFLSAGSHTVRLRVSTAYCQDEIQARVYQFEQPDAQIQYKGHCTDHPIALEDKSTIADGSVLGRRWLLPNTPDLLTNRQVLYVPEDKGWTQLGLISQSQFNCADTAWLDIHVDPSPLADMTYESACDRLPTRFVNKSWEPNGHSNTYIWQLEGQEWTSTDLTYQFDEPGQEVLRLVAWATNGCLDTLEHLVDIGRQPVAAFDHEGQCSEQEVQFVNLTSNTVGTIDFIWHFGDGDSAVGFSPSHTYTVAQDSVFHLSLTARANNGCQTTAYQDLTIGSIPVCGFSVSRSKEDRQIFHFTPLDTTESQYSWWFGTDGQSFDKKPTHRFTHPEETYSVKLQVTTDLACKCTWDRDVLTSWPLSVTDLDVGIIQVWPNPTTGTLWLELRETDQATPLELQLLDALGRQVWTLRTTYPGEAFSLDLDALASGAYTLQVRSPSTVFDTLLRIMH